MEIPLWQRFLAPFIYLLPWSDAVPFGLGLNGLFNQIPLLRLLIIPAIPFIQIQRSVPFGGLLLFFILFLAAVRNTNVPYFLRFNVLQALLTDIVVIVLNFAFSVLLKPVAGGSLLIGTLSSTVVLSVLAILVFVTVECTRGREPDLPALSQAVRMQLY
ncbi:Tic20 family protein [Synechococcus sp. M16CYN]|uniref:Tic20 family protein n=1 Tax=Synechococcus sp. M16CYN TaxID=3103139 RepID=UPI0030E12547